MRGTNTQTSMEKIIKLNIDEARDELSSLSLEEELYKQAITDEKCDLFINSSFTVVEEDEKEKYAKAEKIVKNWLEDIKKQKKKYQYKLDFYKKKRDEIKAKKQRNIEDALHDLNKCPKTISENELQPIKK